MSRSKKIILRPPTYDIIRDVFLNRDGVKIGAVVRWRWKSLAYLSWRNAEHYFIKHHGFGIDKALFWNLVVEDRINLIIIEYTGTRGKRFFVSEIDDWVNHSIEVQHSKEVGDKIETYGVQKVLPESFMDELEVGEYG